MTMDAPSFSRSLTEAHKLAALRGKQEALTPEELNKVMTGNAVWERGINKVRTPAIWKSRDDRGNPVYIINTQRAMAVEKSIGAAIRKFHSSIKGTT